MLFITYRLQVYFLNIRQMASVYINALLQACLKLPYTRLRRSSSIAATSSTVACLISWIVKIRLRNTRSFRNPHRKKSLYSKVGRPSRPSDVAETTNTGNTLLHVLMLHCDWPYEMASSPLPFLFSPTTTSYRAGAIFKFEMCQSAPRHPVYSQESTCLYGIRIYNFHKSLLWVPD